MNDNYIVVPETMTFLSMCRKGLCNIDDVDDVVTYFHNHSYKFGDNRDLNEIIGLNDDEYGMWIKNPSILKNFL